MRGDEQHEGDEDIKAGFVEERDIEDAGPVAADVVV